MKRVAFLIFDGFQLLDAAGPIAAFESASGFHGHCYALEVRAARPGPIVSSSGVVWQARSLGTARNLDTLVIAGGNGTRAAAECRSTRRLLRNCARADVRLASVCSGSYVLAAAGLLDGKPATTHWSRTRDFQERFPKVLLDAERIFTRSGRLWTSAGISAGIDLALALIEDDFGEALARRTAQHLVVYHRRPGGQSQFSALLEFAPSGRFAKLMEYIRSHLAEPLTVTQLAAQSGMSERNFSRAFRAEAGLSPAKAVEKLRAESARAALESGTTSVAEVAAATGYGDAERMRRSLLRIYGVPPAEVKRRARALYGNLDES